MSNRQFVVRLSLWTILIGGSANVIANVAWAQATNPDPLAPTGAPITYRSAFDGYRPFALDDLPSWVSVTAPAPKEDRAPSSQAPAGSTQPSPPALPREPVYADPPAMDHGH
jgi:hypothetical protein